MNLFWRIFLGFWIAMSVIAFTVASLSFSAADRTLTTVQRGPGEMINDARQALARDGRDGLIAWLRQRQQSDVEGPQLLIVDASGAELLGRPVSSMSQRWLERERRRSTRFTLRGPTGEVFRAAMAPPPIRVGPIRFESPRNLIISVALVVSAVVCFGLSRTIVRPIRAVDEAAVKLHHGDLRARTELTGGGAEIVSLGRHFNAMAERVESLLTAQRELLRNVSHELRSPLARLRVALELARDRDDRKADAMVRIERETERLDRLIGRILSLSRLTDREVELQVERVDLTALLHDIVADATFESDGTVAIDLSIPPDSVGVHAEPELLRSAIENVVRNAIRHSPANGRVDVALTSTSDDLVVDVSDEGSGVPDALLSAIFEPFFRSDAAREHGVGGDGVGLAITRAFAEKLGGNVTASNRSPRGLTVSIRLPTSKTERGGAN
ncbi:MAG: ATP-binding protein [Pseudomonadota bacterium]